MQKRTQKENLAQYETRLSRVMEFINHNLDEDLCLEELSQVASLSKFHFHRVFHAYIGTSLANYIQLIRLKRASFQLAFEQHKTIIDIGLEARINNPETFTRAFKRHFQQTPSEFRKNPQWLQWHSPYQLSNKLNRKQPMNVSCVNFPETQVALLSHIGPAEMIMQTASKFIAWRKTTGLSPIATSKTFGIPHSDPKTTEPSEFRWDVCGSINQQIPSNNYGVVNSVIPGGRCAVLQHKGSHDTLDQSIYYIYQQWIGENNEELRDFPCFFHYLNFIHDVDECDLLTDIYVPLK
ncbi:AraC family transcriptional regulator [Alteromonas sp. 5E99-2]|uniref:AraC family transcriptional regulator n=1 Tax=Alteromonas sp. 5E99-2 TaxID=2817683 RepID=UPI001A97F66C|nr:AraC family transcriptional regulator [Alteromonas sp. 5E99-2]MBO1254751.1 AraC family transcriptional regulator [Alteromonas sp. 5E99-2]